MICYVKSRVKRLVFIRVLPQGLLSVIFRIQIHLGIVSAGSVEDIVAGLVEVWSIILEAFGLKASIELGEGMAINLLLASEPGIVLL